MSSNTVGPYVTEIPELLAMIAHGLNTKERGKLMLVSKRFFHSVGPIAWKSVPRLDCIMGLITEAKVEICSTEHFPDDERIYEITVTLPVSPNLGRYNIYAPWVQELELFGNNRQKVRSLDSFLNLLNGRPPLPNLKRLTAYTTIPINSKEIMNLISTFISPSLVEIRTVLYKNGANGALQTSRARLPPSSVPKLLKQIKEACPHICVLEFYPESASGIIYTPNDQCHGALSSFLSLRSFSSTTYILKPKILGILGGLEHLESLGIRGSPTEPPVLNKQLLIPETWFPSLKDLRLYDIHYEDIEVIWKQPTIVKNLTSALVQTDHLTPRNPPDHLLHGQNWIGPFIAAIPQISPCLKDITLFMGNDDMRVEIPRQSWEFIGRGVLSPGDAYSMALWPDLDCYSD